MKLDVFFYNVRGISRFLYPRAWLDRKKILRDVEKRSDYEYILERVDYYNRLNAAQSPCANLLDSETTRESAYKTAHVQESDTSAPTRTPRDAPIKVKNFPFPFNNTRYFFDTHELVRYFDDEDIFILEHGDVNYYLDVPVLCKSRPIERENTHATYKSANNVILNLNKIRHNIFVRDTIPFEHKDETIYFRGGCWQGHRRRFLDMYFDNPRCDIGHMGKSTPKLSPYLKPKTSKQEHLKHKFIISIEGNDVATNLKWIMSSNSLAVSPKLKFETWFMEGQLKGDYHYVEIDENYENLFDKIDFYIKHEDKAKEIIRHANEHCAQFFDKERERIIALLVLEKYFALTKGMFDNV